MEERPTKPVDEATQRVHRAYEALGAFMADSECDHLTGWFYLFRFYPWNAADRTAKKVIINDLTTADVMYDVVCCSSDNDFVIRAWIPDLRREPARWQIKNEEG